MARVLTAAAINVLRDRHYILNPVTGLYERSTLLEIESSNRVLQASNFGTTWVAIGTPTRVAAAHTAAGVTLDLIGDDSAAAVEGYEQTVAFTGNAVKAVSLYVKAGTSQAASGSKVFLHDSTAVVNRLEAGITWVAGVPSVAMTTGTYLGSEALADGVYRLLFATTSVTAANTHLLSVRPTATAAEQGNLYAGGVQAENNPYPTSFKLTTTAAVTRNADQLSFPFTLVPQEMTVYVKFIELGTSLGAAGARLLLIGNGSTAPTFLIRAAVGTGRYDVYHDNNVANVNATLGTAPSYGQLVEILAVLSATGTVTISQSINGAAATTAGPSGALGFAAAWVAQTLWLNSGATSDIGTNAFLAVKTAKGTKTLAEMRVLASMASTVFVLNAGDPDAITVRCADAQKAEKEDIGGRTRAFAGNLRVSTQDQKRVFNVTTAWLDPADEQAIQALIADNVILPCSGLLLDNDTVNCSIKCTGVTMHPGSSLFALSLSVMEV